MSAATVAIVAPPVRIFTGCLACAARQAHTAHAPFTAPLAQRATVTAPHDPQGDRPVIATLNPRLTRALTDLPTATMTELARDTHLRQCLGCKNELCQTGDLLTRAARPDRSWIPEYPTGA